ncbi:hypothetical protein HDU76_001475, partial [Blyttiomyces sp. JEL0837]
MLSASTSPSHAYRNFSNSQQNTIDSDSDLITTAKDTSASVCSSRRPRPTKTVNEIIDTLFLWEETLQDSQSRINLAGPSFSPEGNKDNAGTPKTNNDDETKLPWTWIEAQTGCKQPYEVELQGEEHEFHRAPVECNNHAKKEEPFVCIRREGEYGAPGGRTCFYEDYDDVKHMRLNNCKIIYDKDIDAKYGSSGLDTDSDDEFHTKKRFEAYQRGEEYSPKKK